MSFRALAYGFRMGESTVGNIVMEVCTVLWNKLQPIYLPKPKRNEWLNNAKDYEDLWQFPHCVGAVDGKHVVIRKPSYSGSQFYNYKKTFSTVLLAVVDADYKFTVVDIGSCGKFSDGSILHNSEFGKALRCHELDLPQESRIGGSEHSLPFVFVGDEAFPLMENLMRPFPKNQLQEEKRKIFNYRLSRARRLVESTFGILSARWRVFLKPFEINVENVDKAVKATVVLHNYLRCKKTSGNVEQELQHFIETEGENHREYQLLPLNHLGYNATRKAFQTREKFVDFFNSPEGSVPWQIDALRRGP